MWRLYFCCRSFFLSFFFPPCPSILFLVSLTKTIDVFFFFFSALTFLKQSYYSTHLCEGQKMEASPHFSELQLASYPLILNLFEVLDCNGLTPICGNQVFWISFKKNKAIHILFCFFVFFRQLTFKKKKKFFLVYTLHSSLPYITFSPNVLCFTQTSYQRSVPFPSRKKGWSFKIHTAELTSAPYISIKLTLEENRWLGLWRNYELMKS